MSSIILVAETGADISPEMASQYGIHLVPMHVIFGDSTMDDGSFPVEKIPEYYHQNGKLPSTSGCAPEDFFKAYDELHEKYPEAQFLHLAYSAITTCSYQSSVIASEERDYVTIIDTQQVSAGQANVVIKMAEILKENPDTCVRIPMIGETRSLNLSNSVAIVLYEALRQNNFDHMKLEGQLHRLRWEE